MTAEATINWGITKVLTYNVRTFCLFAQSKIRGYTSIFANQKSKSLIHKNI